MCVVSSKVGFFRADSNRVLPITPIRTGEGHTTKEDKKVKWCSCFLAFHVVQLFEMASGVFATVVRMLEVPTNEALSLFWERAPASLPHMGQWIDRASPVATRSVGCTATAGNHMPEGLLRQNLNAGADWEWLMDEQSSRVCDARKLLIQLIQLGQSPVSLSSPQVEVLVDISKGVANLERCAAVCSSIAITCIDHHWDSYPSPP